MTKPRKDENTCLKKLPPRPLPQGLLGSATKSLVTRQTPLLQFHSHLHLFLTFSSFYDAKIGDKYIV